MKTFLPTTINGIFRLPLIILLLFIYKSAVGNTEYPLACMSLNIYHEARGEPEEGKLAVGLVTLNRKYSKKFPNTICEVVKQRGKRGCQFSWYCTKNHKIEMKDYIDSLLISLRIIGGVYDFTGGSLYYHAKRVRPYWASKFKKVIVIGKHIFYKE